MEEPQIYKSPSKKPNFKLIGVFLLLAVVVIIVYFIYSREPAKLSWESNVPIDPIDELQILATQSHDFEQCVFKAGRLVNKEPNSKEGWEWKALCEVQLGHFQDAQNSFKKLLALDPENERAEAYAEMPDEEIIRLERNWNK